KRVPIKSLGLSQQDLTAQFTLETGRAARTPTIRQLNWPMQAIGAIAFDACGGISHAVQSHPGRRPPCDWRMQRRHGHHGRHYALLGRRSARRGDCPMGIPGPGTDDGRAQDISLVLHQERGSPGHHHWDCYASWEYGIFERDYLWWWNDFGQLHANA